MADNNLKANIPTHEIILANGDIVVFYDFVTTGESREIQRILLEKGEFNSTTQKIDKIPLQVFLESQDKAASFVIKEVKTGGETKPFSHEWLDILPREMGDKVYEEVNNLTQVLQLTEDKKKD